MSDDLSGFSLLELFRLEAESQASVLSSGLLALETDPAAARPETLEQLMRAAHSLKGAARIVGVEAAVRVAHAMEDVFVAAQKGAVALGPPHVDVLLRALDLLTRIAQVAEDDLARWQEEREPEVAAAVAEIKGLLTGETPTPPPAAVEADVPTPIGVAGPASQPVPPYEGGKEEGSSPATPTTATASPPPLRKGGRSQPAWPGCDGW